MAMHNRHAKREGRVPEPGAGLSATGGKRKHKSLKNMARSLKRSLQRQQNEDTRTAKEAELERLAQLQLESKQREKERKYAVRYHKIRFFERRKVERAMERLLKQYIGELPPEKREELRRLKDDLLYIRHFPKGEKYVSILKQESDPVHQQQFEGKRQKLKKLIKMQLGDMAALTEADEGRSMLWNAQHGDQGVLQHAEQGDKQTRKRKREAVRVAAISQNSKKVSQKPDNPVLDDEFFLEGQKEGRAKEPREHSNALPNDTSGTGSQHVEGRPGGRQGIAKKPRQFASNGLFHSKLPPAPWRDSKQGNMTKGGSVASRPGKSFKAPDMAGSAEGTLPASTSGRPHTDWTPPEPRPGHLKPTFPVPNRSNTSFLQQFQEKFHPSKRGPGVRGTQENTDLSRHKSQNAILSREHDSHSVLGKGSAPSNEPQKVHHRTRAEGGRKRRKKK